MKTTLKHIDVGSAFRVGAVLYGLLFVVFGAFGIIFQSLLFSSLANILNNSSYYSGSTPNFNSASVLGVSLVSLLCFYGVGIVAAAIFGGITLAIVAFFYNLSARWVGGLRIDLQADDSLLLDDIERDLRRPRPENPTP